MITAALYDAKSYDRAFFAQVSTEVRVDWHFHEFRLSAETAGSASGVQAGLRVCERPGRPGLSGAVGCGGRCDTWLCGVRAFNNVDLKAAGACGIAVTRVPAYSPHAVAEHAVALLMTLNRKIHRAHSRVRELNFSLKGLVGFDLHGKTVGIVGTGKIGRIAAEIFRGFGTRVLAYDPFPMDAWAEANRITYASMDAVVKDSDVISLHLPLTPETMHLFDHTQFGRIKPGAFLVNTSRGKLIDTTAMIENLKSGKLGGVALDVYEEEEGVFFEDLSDQVLADDELGRLLTFPNVLITAHQAFLTREALTEIAHVTTSNINHLAAGRDPLEGTRLV